jgi:hypothetical protein
MTRPKLVLAAFAGAVLLALVFPLHHATRAYATNPDTTPVTGSITVIHKFHDETDTTRTDALPGGTSTNHHVYNGTDQGTTSYTGINAQPDPNSEGGSWLGPANANFNYRQYTYEDDKVSVHAKGGSWSREEGSETNIDGGAPSQAIVQFERHTDPDTLVTTCSLTADFDSSNGANPPPIKGTIRTWKQDSSDRGGAGSSGSAGQGQTQETAVPGYPGSVHLTFTCDPNATSISGEQNDQNPNAKNSTAISWHLHLGPEPETEVEIIKPDGYDNWMPQGGDGPSANEDTVGNFMVVQIVAHKKGDPNADPPKPVKSYKITLDGTSQEKGVDLNWPNPPASTPEYDLGIDPQNDAFDVIDAHYQFAEVHQEGLNQFMVKVNCYDWGGYTNLKVTATLVDGSTVEGHVQGNDGQQKLAIPRDDNSNHIADAWEEQFGVSNTSESADDDDNPPGDGTKGDSIALYDEYRGFHVGGKHERLSPNTKDLFIWDMSSLGYGLYQSATGVAPHLVKDAEVDSGGSGANPNTVTPNGSHGKVYAILLRTGSIAGGVLAETEGGPSTPDNIQMIIVDTSMIAAAYGAAAAELKAGNPQAIIAAEQQSTIAHELSHATNVWHHGDGKEYNVGDTFCRRPDGSVKNYMCSTPSKAGKLGAAGKGCYEVAVKGGLYSGNDQCIMRYDMTNFFEDPNGNCQAKGFAVPLSLYGMDPPGTQLCDSPLGTGVNAPPPGNPHCKAGDATRGNCKEQLRVKSGGG